MASNRRSLTVSFFIVILLSFRLSYSRFLDDSSPPPYAVDDHNHHHDHGDFKGGVINSMTQLFRFERYLSQEDDETTTVLNVDDFGAQGNGNDDTKAFEDAWEKACSSKGATVLVAPQKRYILKPIRFEGPCKSSNLTVEIQGTLEGSDRRSDYLERSWILFESVQNLTVQGGGTLLGHGDEWWSRSCRRNKSYPCTEAPTGLTFRKCENLVARDLTVQNAPQMQVAFEKCISVRASHLTVIAPERSPNTDGIHVTHTQDIEISNSDIGSGDDCISIVSGSRKVRAIDITCGPGHGISVGSLGRGNSEAHVSDIIVNGARFYETMNGVRIKSWPGGSGSANNMTFMNIEMNNVQNPIIIDQNYCAPKKNCAEKNTAVQVKDILYQNITGTSAAQVAIKFDCSRTVKCEGIVLQDVDLRQYRSRDRVQALCNNVESTDIGVVTPHCPNAHEGIRNNSTAPSVQPPPDHDHQGGTPSAPASPPPPSPAPATPPPPSLAPAMPPPPSAPAPPPPDHDHQGGTSPAPATPPQPSPAPATPPPPPPAPAMPPPPSVPAPPPPDHDHQGGTPSAPATPPPPSPAPATPPPPSPVPATLPPPSPTPATPPPPSPAPAMSLPPSAPAPPPPDHDDQGGIPSAPATPPPPSPAPAKPPLPSPAPATLPPPSPAPATPPLPSRAPATLPPPSPAPATLPPPSPAPAKPPLPSPAPATLPPPSPAPATPPPTSAPTPPPLDHDQGGGNPPSATAPPSPPLAPAPPPHGHHNKRGKPPSVKCPSVFCVDDFGAKGNGEDDTEAFKKAWERACSSKDEAVLVVPHKNYLVKPIRFNGPCNSNVAVQILGTIEASNDRSDYSELGRHWLWSDGVNDLVVEGGGTINGNGDVWWKNSCTINKSISCQEAPTALTFHQCERLRVKDLRIKDSQQIHVSFEHCSHVNASNLNITAPESSPNTDGIHVSHTKDIGIYHCAIETGNDCISIVSESHKVRAAHITCGPGHGISIGSLGHGNSEAHVSDVIVKNATLSRTMNGLRIKTWQGGSGSASNIKFIDIEMNNVRYPIIIDQNYCDQQKPCKKQSSAVQVRDVLYQNITGTSSSDVAVRFDCSESLACEGIVMRDVELQRKRGDKAEAFCNNVKFIDIGGEVSPMCPH